MSVSVPAEVVSLNSTVFFTSIFSTLDIVTPMAFLTIIVTPLSLEKFPKMSNLLINFFWLFFHFLRPLSSSLLSTMMWISALTLVMVCNLSSAFLPSGHKDRILVQAMVNSLRVFWFFGCIFLQLVGSFLL